MEKLSTAESSGPRCPIFVPDPGLDRIFTSRFAWGFPTKTFQHFPENRAVRIDTTNRISRRSARTDPASSLQGHCGDLADIKDPEAKLQKSGYRLSRS